MHAEHVPLVADLDRAWLAFQAFLALALVVAVYATLKLRTGWWRPHRPRR